MADFTLDATIQSARSGWAALDAEITARGFTMDAWIVNDRWRHHRERDHFGPESDLHVVLSEDVEGYPASTPIHFVLDDLVRRLTNIESSNRVRASFTADAYLYKPATASFDIDATIKGSVSDSFTVDGFFTDEPFGTFALDAFIGSPDEDYGQTTFTIDAFIV